MITVTVIPIWGWVFPIVIKELTIKRHFPYTTGNCKKWYTYQQCNVIVIANDSAADSLSVFLLLMALVKWVIGGDGRTSLSRCGILGHGPCPGGDGSPGVEFCISAASGHGRSLPTEALVCVPLPPTLRNDPNCTDGEDCLIGVFSRVNTIVNEYGIHNIYYDWKSNSTLKSPALLITIIRYVWHGMLVCWFPAWESGVLVEQLQQLSVAWEQHDYTGPPASRSLSIVPMNL